MVKILVLCVEPSRSIGKRARGWEGGRVGRGGLWLEGRVLQWVWGPSEGQPGPYLGALDLARRGGSSPRVTCITPIARLTPEDMPQWQSLKSAGTSFKGIVTRTFYSRGHVLLKVTHPETKAVAEGQLRRERNGDLLPNMGDEVDVKLARVIDKSCRLLFEFAT